MFARNVNAFIVIFIAISVSIVCVTCSGYHRRREMYDRRSYDERPSRSSHSILSTSDDGQGYELQLDGDSHITSYLKALDVPEPLSRNPHIIASFDESLIPSSVARRLAQRRASEAATVDSDQSTSNQTHEGSVKEESSETVKPLEVVQLKSTVEPEERPRQEKETMSVKEAEVVVQKKHEQSNKSGNRLPIGGRMSPSQSEAVSKYEEVVEKPARREPTEKRQTIRVTPMETQEFTERVRGSSQEAREFVLLMDSERSSTQPSLFGNLRSRPSRKNHREQSPRQSLLVPVPFEQSIRDLRSQTFRAAQLGSDPSQMKTLQMVLQEPDTRNREVRESMREVRDSNESIRDSKDDNTGGLMQHVRHSNPRSPLVQSCLQLCSCCSTLLGKNLVPLLV